MGARTQHQLQAVAIRCACCVDVDSESRVRRDEPLPGDAASDQINAWLAGSGQTVLALAMVLPVIMFAVVVLWT